MEMRLSGPGNPRSNEDVGKDGADPTSLFNKLELMGFQKDDRADDLPRKGRNLLVDFYNESVKDAYGALKGDVGWIMLKRRFTFYNYPILLILVHGSQAAICLFILFTRATLDYHLYSAIVAFLFCGAKVMQGYKIIYRASFGPGRILYDRFMEIFPFMKCFGCLALFAFYFCSFSFGVGAAVSDTVPTITLFGMFSAGVSALIALCGLISGITAGSAFEAISAFVGFRFIGEMDELFVNRMTIDCTIEDLVHKLKPEDRWYNYVLYILGMGGAGCGIVFFMLLPFILVWTGVKDSAY